MRRLRQAEKRQYALRRYHSEKDLEGNTYAVYAGAVGVEAIIRHSSGKLTAEQYGERAAYILAMQYDGKEEIALGAGICVFVPGTEEPDYRIIEAHELTSDSFRLYKLEAIR